jgi:hypothetical protein
MAGYTLDSSRSGVGPGGPDTDHLKAYGKAVHFCLIRTAAIMCSPYHVVYLPKGAGNFDWEEPALEIGWLVQA